MNRPVLQLQVKPTTLERARRRVGSASSGSFSRNTYTYTAAAAGAGAESSAYGEDQTMKRREGVEREGVVT